MFLTTTVLGPRHAAADRKLADYNAILHRLAQKYGYRVAEVNRRLRAAQAAGLNLLEDDQVHLTFAGYRVLTAAVLEGLLPLSDPITMTASP